MMYCTKCGSNLKGNKVRCPVCGYEVQKMKMDLMKTKEARPASGSDRRPWAPPIPDQRSEPEMEEEREPVKREEPEGIKFKPNEEEEDREDNDPRFVEGCSVCGAKPVRRCFFTMAPLCERHTVWLQIYVRNMPFGERVASAPEIGREKEGRVPTQMEAEEAGMFFSIKPYHTWKKVR
jgi:hypothetical protein